MKKFILEITVFIGGAVVMVYELAGSRVLAPYLGTSLVTWTNLIGIILGSLSLGYYIGGQLADQKPKVRILSIILLVAAILIFVTTISKDFILVLIIKGVSDIRLAGIITTIILFAPASIFLGMISPYAIRLKINSVEQSGVTVGGMYAISTIGSIAGTFLAGFYLIPTFGTTSILYILTFALIFNSMFLSINNLLRLKVVLLLMIFVYSLYLGTPTKALGLKSLVDIDTQYNRVWVYDTIDAKTQRPVRHLRIDPYGIQGGIFLDQDDSLIFDYLKFYRISKHFFPNPEKALFVGGGVYRYPRDFVEKNPNTHLDVVEIDPGLTEIARKYFNFHDDPQISVFHEDGRTFVNKQTEKYDIIFIDAFNSRLAIPFQLTTREFVQQLYNILNDNGVVLINIISGLSGENGKFFQAEYRTYKEVFPLIDVFPVNETDNLETVQNIIMVAHKYDQEKDYESENEELAGYLSHRISTEVQADLPVLTDDYAPVDFYVLSFSK